MKKNDSFPDNCTECKHSGVALCSLTNEEKTLFNDAKYTKILKKGDVIFSQSHYPTGIYAVYEGKIKIAKIGEEGKEQIVRFAKAGDIIGYRSLLSEEAYRASATALGDAKICHIPRDVFFKVLRENHWLYKDLMLRLAKDLKAAEEKIISISQKSVKERIAETLILLHHKFGSKSNDSINVKLSRKEIGNIAGSTIETTIRTLSSLKKEGYIAYDGKDIIVKDINKLIQIANIH